jgi:chemotaxis protein methyltransferase CheR
MTTAVYKFFEEMLKRESGLIITPDKIYLLEARLIPVASKHGIEGVAGIASRLQQANDPVLLREVVEAMVTGETSFFRDNAPFENLRKSILPPVMKARAASRTLRILSAACSTGQEPYSLAIMLKEDPAFLGWKCDIVAADLSQEALEYASNAAYSQFEVQRGLPVRLLVKYFTQDGEKWRLAPAVRDMVRFQPINLLAEPQSLGVFDIVFCRNVLIYFDVPTKAKVLQHLRSVLRQDGALFLGGTETVLGVTDTLKPVDKMPGVFLRSDSTLPL